MSLSINYHDYLDKILGGWIGKCIGGTIGARFEGNKSWIEIDPACMFPDEVPPNDDLDLQILWLKVLEEKGAALESADLAQAWLEGCWYPFNEYGIFRRNWMLGIHPPMSGRFTNHHWDTGMGCPIRSEIWGYVFPGAPQLAAEYAWKDGTLDHTEQSVGAEQMFSAMASMAFFDSDLIGLAKHFLHYLPSGSPIRRLVDCAFQSHAEGLPLRLARERIMLIGGNPEVCDAQVNVPFTILSILYGDNDFEKTILSALACGFDTDCTLATAAAFLGQIFGARRIPQSLKDPIGDTLVMGIEYTRPEMTISALARDTARIGVLLSKNCETGTTILDAPQIAPLPPAAHNDTPRILINYPASPCVRPGESTLINLDVKGKPGTEAQLKLTPPGGWSVVPPEHRITPTSTRVQVKVTAPQKVSEFPLKNLFKVSLTDSSISGLETELAHTSFGVAGAVAWKVLGVFYDVQNPQEPGVNWQRILNHNFVSLHKPYVSEPDLDVDQAWKDFSALLGAPAVIYSYQREIDLGQLIGLKGACCVYLGRTIICPEEEDYFVVVGNTEPCRLYINQVMVGESTERLWWTPFNTVWKTRLKKGKNQLLLKLIKSADDFRFTIDFRPHRGSHASMNHHHSVDWQVDFKEVISGE